MNNPPESFNKSEELTTNSSPKKVAKPKVATIKTSLKEQKSKQFGIRKVFKRLAFTIAGFVGVALVPLITLAASDNDPYNTQLFKEITVQDVRNNVEYTQLPTVNVSYGELIRGTKNYNNGNYVLYLGTEACGHCAEFLFSNADFAKGTPPLGNGANNASWIRGIWGQGINYAANNITNPAIKFIMFEDKPQPSLDAFSDRKFTLPWATDASSSLDAGIVAGQYIRNDESAINFREIFAFAKANYHQVVGTPMVIAFKDGLFNWYNLSETQETAQTQANEVTPEVPEPSPTPPEPVAPTVNTAGTIAKFIEFLNNLYNVNN